MLPDKFEYKAERNTDEPNTYTLYITESFKKSTIAKLKKEFDAEDITTPLFKKIMGVLGAKTSIEEDDEYITYRATIPKLLSNELGDYIAGEFLTWSNIGTLTLNQIWVLAGQGAIHIAETY